MKQYEIRRNRMSILFNLVQVKLKMQPTSKNEIIKVLEQLVFDASEYEMLTFLTDTTHKEIEAVAEWYENTFGIKA